MKNKRLKRRRRITSFLLALLLAGALIYLVADKNQPAKVSADFETITLYGKTYVRTDELPPDAKYPLINSDAQILTVNFPSFCTEIACKPSGWLRDFCYI